MLEQRIRHGSKNSRAYIMPIERTINIDEERDLLVARTILEKNPKLHMVTKISREEAKNKVNNYV